MQVCFPEEVLSLNTFIAPPVQTSEESDVTAMWIILLIHLN